MLPWKGKWVYIWYLHLNFDGHIPSIIDELLRADVQGVAVKIHNGVSCTRWNTLEMQQFQEACKEAGIGFGMWGYIFLYDPQGEAQMARRMIAKYEPDFYLIDAEAQAKGRYTQAWTFANELKGAPTKIGLASYRFPSYHRKLPWQALRSCCDFDSPQVYYRLSDPPSQLARSKAAFAAMLPKLPFFPAGDMYHEHGIRPTPEAVQRYLQACKDDPDISGTLMWAMFQRRKCPELWEVFSEFEWAVDEPEPNEGHPIELTAEEREALLSIARKLE